jgi:hypothetical protein
LIAISDESPSTLAVALTLSVQNAMVPKKKYRGAFIVPFCMGVLSRRKAERKKAERLHKTGA